MMTTLQQASERACRAADSGAQEARRLAEVVRAMMALDEEAEASDDTTADDEPTIPDIPCPY